MKKFLLIMLGVLMTLPCIAREFTYKYKGQALTYTVLNEEAKTVSVRNSGNPGNNISGKLILPALPRDGAVEYTLSSIAGSAFWNCSGLTSVTIPNSVTKIGNYAFNGCSGLTEVIIPASVSEIGVDVFFGCRGLTLIEVESANKYFASADGVLFNKDKNLLHTFPCGRKGDYAIPNSVTEIGRDAFSGCSGLTSVTIPNSVTKIGDYAFLECRDLTEVIIPNSVTKIGDYAFLECRDLTEVIIPNSVTKIGDYAFNSCSGLTEVTIPASVSEIGDIVFSGCSGLTLIEVESANKYFASVDGVLFNKDKNLLHTFPGGRKGDYVVPTSVTKIGNNAFSRCSGITSVTIPNSVTKIGDNAFSRCSGLTSVTIPNSVTEIGQSAFNDCSGLTRIYYKVNEPVSGYVNIFSGETYETATLYTTELGEVICRNIDPWKNFKHIIVSDFSVILVNKLSFKQDNYSVVPGKTLNLNDEVVIMPEDATEKSLIWKSSDVSVAKVNAGVVTVLTPGKCEITATTTDGSNLTAKCNINTSSDMETIMEAETSCNVYNVSGMLLMRDATLKEVTSLAPGIYIVRQGNDVKKIVVK